MNNNDVWYTHLKPSPLKDSELFIGASLDIQHSFTGRVDMIGLHRFFVESSIMVRNAVKLFEEGFFDAAFYSVRSGLELARIVTYLSNEDLPQHSDKYKDWATGGRFPMDKAVRDELEKSSAVYQEVREVLSDFFDAQDKRLKTSQKYIHKQGYKAFYERGFTDKEKEKVRLAMIATDFSEFTKNSLAEIALLRLCIDPFPILLRDPNVMYKIHSESMTEAYSDDTVNKIIGKARVKLYCSTEYYKSHVNYFDSNEALSEEAHTLINDQFYDRSKWSVIKRQLKLLSSDDVIAVKVFSTSKKIAKIYTYGGFKFYFSDVKTARKQWGFNSDDLLKVKESAEKVNRPYSEAYLSYVIVGELELWLEHNVKLTKSELSTIERIN